jgi:hypothetical protein
MREELAAGERGASCAGGEELPAAVVTIEKKKNTTRK